ncbi:leucine-rich repeat protein [Artemisia annua]|uniref:non-specific serine/threonine protein kinase n=1 Tax=Artemisia annua TaxID=35608 RepID=A0A2U1NK63_ARTAN|nr:leucine-rich repeat protein [Artemisia annua]
MIICLAITCLTSSTVSVSYGGNETDYHALLSFKSMITHDPYNVLTSWNHSFHFCDWSGISCGKRHKRVTALRLKSHGLEGSLSPHVGNLSFLRELHLGNNSFQGTIPHELGRLSRLCGLYLSINKFSGVIPTNLSGCSNLEDLWLYQNELTGSIPEEMSLLSKLSPQAIIHLSSSSLISFLFYGLAITCLTSATVFASHGGNETDYHALLSFKSMITHDPYKVLTSWNHSFHFCDWSGISCGKRHKRVTALRLVSQGLEGSLSPHVGNLSFLHELSLANNSFQGTIPHEVGRLSRLRRLNLNINKFSGFIPTNLSGCSNLEKILLGQNELTGSIPKEMGLLSKLATLGIYYNKLTGGIPPFLGNITSMEVFSVVGNPFGGSIPDTVGHWKSLTTFYSGGCNLYGSIPHSIFNLSLLVNFSLPDNHLTGSLPSEIGNQLPNLELLQLRGNELTGVLPPSLSNCSKLGSLEMSDNNFSGKLTIDFSKLRDIYFIALQNNNFHGRGEADDLRFVDSLKNCTKLVDLGLGNCNLRGVLPISIGNLSNQLSFLSLAENQLFGSLPSSIGSLVGLTTLYLGDNRFKGKIPSTIGKLQKLQRLALSRNHFSGPIPDAIGNLSLLNKLYLYSNKLEGNIPPSLGSCKKLIGLQLSDNRLSGKIPKQLFQLPSLTNFLSLERNNLSGSIPSEIKNLKMLSYLDLSYNNLSGTITSSLGECKSLTELYLSGNRFEGIIPSSLSSLGGLGVLDISQNNLSGRIPQFLEKWKSLEFLNLSFNAFEGEVPVVGVFANASAFSVRGNNRLCGGLVTLELPKCKETGSKNKRFRFFILVIVIASTLLVVLCCVYLLCKKKRNSQPSRSSGSERFMKVSYNQLLKATDGFSVENLIGEGAFSSVYKGILDSDDDKFVAIKVLRLHNQGAHKSFLAECEAWRNIRHRNVLKIITSCSSVDFQGNDFKALVYEFMPNGSVHDWLHSSAYTSKLNLLQRINILRDVATALDYLHNRCQTTIVHGDLKPSNILLDDDMVAHVGDFGLARLLEEREGQGHQQMDSVAVTTPFNFPQLMGALYMGSKHVLKVDSKGAKKFALKAQNLFPGLEGISQLLAVLDVHVAAKNKVSGESDYYGILGVYRRFLRTCFHECIYLQLITVFTKSAAARTAGADAQTKTKKKTKSQKDETNGIAKTVPTSVPSSSIEQIALETSMVKGSRKKNKVNGTTKVGPTSAPASSNEQIAPETMPGSCLTEVKTSQEKDQYEFLRKYLNRNMLCLACYGPFHATEIPTPNIKAYSEVAGISQGTGNNISAPETCKIKGIEAGNGISSQRGPLKRDREEAQLDTNIEEALRNKIAKKEAKSASKKIKSVKKKQDINRFDAIKETRPIKNQLIKKATTEIKKKLDEWSSEAEKVADMANGFTKSNEADVPDPDFHDFVHKVISLNPFKMKVCWLSSKPNKKPLPFPGFLEAFSEFQPGKHETITSPNYFSHKASFTKQRNEIVEVDEYSEERGITVTPLVKVAGFKTVFHRHLNSKETKVIPENDFLKISHQILSYLLMGQESANAPKGCLDLDPAAIPPEFLHVLTDVQEADTMDINNGPSADGVCSI